jgi:DNA-binding NarL/FixJ family response regulator
VISSAINDIILKLFDCASQGTPYLLAHITQLMSCRRIRLLDETTGLEAANDIILVNETDWQPNSTTKPMLQLLEPCPNNPCGLMLAIDSQPPFDNTGRVFLVFDYESQALADDARNATFLQELMPHIQQAVMIALQISEQVGDNQALHYVIANHPLRMLFHAPASLDMLPAAKELDHHKQATAANDIFELEVSKESLIAHFKLSPSEIELAKALFKGFSLNEITEVRNVSKQTVRKQLQSILRKTGADSQEALIVLLFDKCLLSQLESGIHSSNPPLRPNNPPLLPNNPPLLGTGKSGEAHFFGKLP